MFFGNAHGYPSFVLHARQSPKSLAISRNNSTILLFVLLLLSLGCDQNRPFPSLTAPTETIDSATLPVSQTNGQGTIIDEFTSDDGVPLASLSSKVQQVVPAVIRINTDSGSGSGAIAQTQGNIGYIVTNHHVVQGATWIQVKVRDGAAYQAEILGEFNSVHF